MAWREDGSTQKSKGSSWKAWECAASGGQTQQAGISQWAEARRQERPAPRLSMPEGVSCTKPSLSFINCIFSKRYTGFLFLCRIRIHKCACVSTTEWLWIISMSPICILRVNYLERWSVKININTVSIFLVNVGLYEMYYLNTPSICWILGIKSWGKKRNEGYWVVSNNYKKLQLS